jgi:hypothetical protein
MMKTQMNKMMMKQKKGQWRRLLSRGLSPLTTGACRQWAVAPVRASWMIRAATWLLMA